MMRLALKTRIHYISQVPCDANGQIPGTIVSTDPLVVACGQGAVRVDSGQSADGVYMTGAQLARELNLVEGVRLGPRAM